MDSHSPKVSTHSEARTYLLAGKMFRRYYSNFFHYKYILEFGKMDQRLKSFAAFPKELSSVYNNHIWCLITVTLA